MLWPAYPPHTANTQILAIYTLRFDPIFIILPGGVRTSRLLQDVEHDLLYMTTFDLELYISCTMLQAAWNIRMRQNAFQVEKIKFDQNGQISLKTVKYHKK